MRVLAVGGGAREHAIVSALVRSGADVFACLKNKNPGICRAAETYHLVDESDVPRVVEFAKANRTELAVIGPEAPLEVGLADGLEAAGIPTASPSKSAARIETSKSFMRELLMKHKVRGSIKFKIADSTRDVELALNELGTGVVVKPIGLTGGKGVKVFGEHMMNNGDVLAYADEVFAKRIGGSARIVIEEKLIGEEFTIQAFCDGSKVVPMPAVQDHKRAFEGDQGPNTGGMGSYSQKGGLLPFLQKNEYESAVKIMEDVVEALKKEGSEYHGALYGQFMLTREGPKVIEFNARFGDPEAMNVLSLLESDFVNICQRIADGRLSNGDARFMPKSSVCKYVVPEGYGIKSLSGEEITVDERAIANTGALLYYASVNEKDGKVYTTTSRSVGLVGIADEIEDAEQIAENSLQYVKGRVHVRHDIAKKVILDAKVARMERVRRGGT
ncbi:MAG: phosphoribosylamine--glycine ligase [Euryarchaeota archaeon RBG_19FT_COMBO_56_21]|nr:MAG: phosphoribosylamine--glycine ligase [Euryarchaeota archaeon RBG_19FT_COMBO_56_21]